MAGGPVQIAYGVTDVRAAASRWTAYGAGPFFVRDHIPVDEVKVDGRPGVFDHSSAYGQWGQIMVELVAVHEPSSLAPTGAGIHHVAYFVASHDQAAAELADAGFLGVLRARAGATWFSFHDARTELGHLIEIYEATEPLRRFYAMVAEAAAGWDGRDPIR
jgi:catechol 2,3-dioxygenase-like lactoylglutathione lyase family enzyme